MSGRKIPELEFTLPSDDFCYLLEHFYSVKTMKGEKITYSEIKAYSEMMHLNLSAFEVQTIMAIDRIFEAKT